jgi:hypothetical protein
MFEPHLSTPSGGIPPIIIEVNMAEIHSGFLKVTHQPGLAEYIVIWRLDMPLKRLNFVHKWAVLLRSSIGLLRNCLS